MPCKRCQERHIRRNIEAVARDRWGQKAKFKIYVDVSDGNPDDYDACLQHDPPIDGQLFFPKTNNVFTAETKIEALEALLSALKKTELR